MSAFAVAHLRNVSMGTDITEYLERIDDTLAPFGGRFLIHGGEKLVLEGIWPGHLIVIAFPDLARARAWYDSPGYQKILPLRLNNAEGDVILAPGVSDDHRTTDVLSD